VSQNSLTEHIRGSLAEESATVFLRRDFAHFGSYESVGSALRALIRQGALVKAGRGIYVKARPSSLNGKPIPVAQLMVIGMEVMRKLGVQAKEGKALQAYSTGRSTQMPMAATLNVGNARIRRRIGFGSTFIQYERE